MENERTVKSRGPRPSASRDPVTRADRMVRHVKLMLPPLLGTPERSRLERLEGLEGHIGTFSGWPDGGRAHVTPIRVLV